MKEPQLTTESRTSNYEKKKRIKDHNFMNLQKGSFKKSNNNKFLGTEYSVDISNLNTSTYR